MSTHTITSTRREQTRAVLLAMIMVTSVFAMSVSFVGTAAAFEEPEPEIELEETLDADIDEVSNIEYDEGEDTLFVIGYDDIGTSTLWAVDPDTQSIEWSVDNDDFSGSLFGNEEIVVNHEYVVLMEPDYVHAVDRESQEIAMFERGMDTAEEFYDIDVDDDYVYVGGDGEDLDQSALFVLQPNTENGDFDVVFESESDNVDYIDTLAVDDTELAIWSPDDTVDVHEFGEDPTTIDLENPTVSEGFAEYDSNFDLKTVGLEYDNGDAYLLEHDGEWGDIEPGYLRALSVDTDAVEITETWRTSIDGVRGETDRVDFGFDENWVYTHDETSNDVVALDRDDGEVGWSINDDVDTDANIQTMSAGSDDDSIDLYAYVDSGSEHLWGITDGLTGADSDSHSGTISTTVDSPHPDVSGIGLTSTNPGIDITEEGVGQPKGTYELSIGLDGDLANVDRVDAELYRVDELGEKLAEDPTEDEYYNLTITFDETGDATVTSEHDSNTHLSATVIDGIDRDADTDSTVIEITFPEDVRPSANTQDDGVNDYSWEVTSTSVNEAIEEEDDPETMVDSFEIGTLVDAMINTGAVEEKEDLILPGFEDVAHGPIGADDAISIEAGGNVEVDIAMSATDLEHETEDDVISADNTKVLAGADHTLDDYGHVDVTHLSNAPSDVGASALTNGQSEEFRMWVDYPEDIAPGEYNGEFTFTVVEIGAS